MKKLGTFVATVLVLTGVACTKERTIQTSSEVREKSSDSTRVAEAPARRAQHTSRDAQEHESDAGC
jgi:hypothetical protein